MGMLKGDRVVLTEEARSRFPDLGTRAGIVVMMDGHPVIEWDGKDFRVRLSPEYLEAVQ